MRQPISWSALADAAVGVWGLGVEGQASIRRLRSMGRDPVLVDDAPSAPAIDGLEVLATGAGGLAALQRCDVVVKSPGISRYRAEVADLEGAGVAVCGGLGLFMAEADPTTVACITGTKGKSTTTALAVHLLNGLGLRARAGGNIGSPPWDPSGEPPPDFWIIETSSFQVPDLQNGPRVVAVTSLAPDHLDWHGTVERYYADKLSLCTKPGVALALADGADEELRAHADLLGPHLQWVGDAEVDAGPDVGSGARPARAAQRAERLRRTCRARGARHPGRLRRRPAGRSGAGFRRAAQPLPFARHHRRGRVRRRRPLDQRLAGAGRTPGLRRAPRGAARRRPRPRGRLHAARHDDRGPLLADARRDHAGQRAAYRSGGARRQRRDRRRGRCGQPRCRGRRRVPTWAQAGGVVLLSPAAPSFGRFADYRERSAAFAKAASRHGTLS